MTCPPLGAADRGSAHRHNDRTRWLTLELGVATHLRRLNGVDVDAPPGREGRHPLVLEAAHTLFPEAGVENLPHLAREELVAGLNGPLRQQIAATEAREEAVNQLRDQLVAQISGHDPQKGAIVVADQVHLRRLVRGQVPAIVALACLHWYGAYRQPGDPNADAITALHELEQSWLHHPEQRTRLDERIMAVAVNVVGQHPTTLLDDPV